MQGAWGQLFHVHSMCGQNGLAVALLAMPTGCLPRMLALQVSGMGAGQLAPGQERVPGLTWRAVGSVEDVLAVLAGRRWMQWADVSLGLCRLLALCRCACCVFVRWLCWGAVFAPNPLIQLPVHVCASLQRALATAPPPRPP